MSISLRLALAIILIALAGIAHAQCLEETLTGDSGKTLGVAVILDGNRIFAGSPSADSGHGRVFVFEKIGIDWVLTTEIAPNDTTTGFGGSLALDGNVLVVGAPNDSEAGDQAGAAYVLRWNGSSWVHEQKLKPISGVRGNFGGSTSVQGDAIGVGATF